MEVWAKLIWANLLFAIGFLVTVQCLKLTDVTDSLFGGKSSGIPAAFGDFNADNYVDIFVIDDEGHNLYVLLASRENSYTRKNLTHSAEEPMTGVQPGDFDGDLHMDLLVTKQTKTNGVLAQVYWGDGQKVTPNKLNTNGKNISFSTNFYGQPFLLDYDVDLRPDIMGETEPGKRIVWVASTSGKFTNKTDVLSKGSNPAALLVPSSNAFLDLNGDYVADIMLTTKEGYEVWLNEEGKFVFNRTIQVPSPDGTAGQVSFGDFDQDGVEDMILPVCSDTDCKEHHIYVNSRISDNWTLLVTQVAGGDWEFNPYDQDKNRFPITLHIGDFNMDGFTDFITTLRKEDNSESRAFLLENVPCTSEECGSFGRTFQNTENSVLAGFNDVLVATFYDVYEDGNLGVLLANIGDDKIPVIRALRQTSTVDACFIRVMVASGLCSSTCVNSDKAPYGVNQPGAAVKYKTTSIEGDEQKSCGSQLSQSAYFSLQLPYVQFGLGLTPNFVDQVAVGMPTNTSVAKKDPLMKEWTQIIPNSKLLVIPYPYDKPYKWTLKLFVHPSNSLYLTGASLGGTMIFMAAIAGILHWRERREDMKEKRQDAHKFHFDAM